MGYAANATQVNKVNKDTQERGILEEHDYLHIKHVLLYNVICKKYENKNFLLFRIYSILQECILLY